MKESGIGASFKQLILAKETQLELDGKLLKDQLNMVVESLKPINLIKETFKETVEKVDIKEKIINSIIGFATGFLARKVIMGQTRNPLTKILGMVVERTVANKATLHGSKISSIGGGLIKKIMGLNNSSEKK